MFTNKVRSALLTLALLALCAMPAMATDPTYPDASGVLTTAQTTFVSVGGLISAVVGFFVVVKIIKWIRK
jgi:hypothetical protein